MSDWEIIHKDYDADGELSSLLVLEDGEPTQKNAIPENVLLYIHGLRDFLVGNKVIELEDGVHVASREEGYVLVVDGNLVEIPPKENERFLNYIKDYMDGETSVGVFKDLHADIIKDQVRRPVVNALRHTFGEKKFDIQPQGNGWLIEDMFLVDWNANVYTKEDDPEEGDYIRGGGGVVKTDKSYEFVQLRGPNPDPKEVNIGGERVMLTEQEMVFLSKVMWLLGRHKYHPDEPFWKYVEEELGDDRIPEW